MNDPTLLADKLEKKFGDRVAVSGVSFEVRPGEIFGLLGPNGAGKTTTISMAAGLLAPDAGRVRVCGLELATDVRAAKALIGLVPQELAVYSTLTARENLELVGRLYGHRGKDLASRVDRALEIVSLTDRARDLVRTFSGGMKRRVNIAAGLVHTPKIAFFDEPTVGVDPQSRSFIFDAIERLASEGLAVLYTTHYMEEAERLCHRLAILDNGKLIAEGTSKELVGRLGGGLVIVGLAESSPASLAADLGKLDSVEESSRIDGRLTLKTKNPAKTLAGVVELLGKSGSVASSLEIHPADLEGVFLSLTGRSLRDE